MRYFSVLLPLLLSASLAGAQADSSNGTRVSAQYAARVAQVRATQPGWASPLASESLRLNQGIRYDAVREKMPTGQRAWYLGSPMVFATIPFSRVETAIVVPERVWNNHPSLKDGAGDIAFAAKYRILSANEHEGNYVMSAWGVVTLPTGSYGNGSPNASFIPGLGVGKGFGAFAGQTTLSATLPTGVRAVALLGRPIAWNSMVEYRFRRIFVPELEDNLTLFKDGLTDGLVQNFVTPGLWISSLPLHGRGSSSPRAIALGAAMQVATSRLPTYNHGLILSGRILF